MFIKNKNIDDRIIKLLHDRGIESKSHIEDFLYPDIKNFHDPFLLSGMQQAVDRIITAIKNKENIVIYGDYDCDGVCASSMLYLFLMTQGLEPLVFIPDRFEDGYGISEETITEITQDNLPDLLITVDCGISAIKEVNLLKNLGVDVIVTDHHEPGLVLPDCTIINPKIKNQSYPFNGLSGAGVVFKLIHALSDLDTAIGYIDICAISTVGDIVPLLDENRIISSLGIKIINSSKTKPFVRHIKKKLKIENITSSELAFKIVPRINATGRMGSSIKSFEYFVSKSKERLEAYFEEIEQDNNDRLKSTNEALGKILPIVEKADLNNSPAIFIYEPTINLGIIGIIASRLCNQFNRPVFVFSNSDASTLKCSVRSIPGINIFDTLSKAKDLLVDMGGHELAGGLTILKKNLKAFEVKIQSILKSKHDKTIYLPRIEYDFEITEKDFSMPFVEQINMLEPFGHMNKKPVFLFKNKKFDYVQLKSFKHYRILTQRKNEIMSFFGDKYRYCFDFCEDISTTIELDINEFAGKKKVKGILKHATCKPSYVEQEGSFALAKSMLYLYLSLNKPHKNSHVLHNIKDIINLNYQTLIVADKFDTFVLFKDKHNLDFGSLPDAGGKTKIVYNPLLVLDKNSILLYKYIIFADSQLSGLSYELFNKSITFNQSSSLFDFVAPNRKKFAECFRLVKPASANNFIDLLLNIQSRASTFGLEEIAFCLLVSAELGFFRLEIGTDETTLSIISNPPKKELGESKIYNMFAVK